MGQTEITGCYDSLMHKNGEENVVNFVGAKSRHHFVRGGSRHLLPNLTDMHWKLSAGFGLCVDRVPVAYKHDKI
jgi:hypothetical protein